MQTDLLNKLTIRQPHKILPYASPLLVENRTMTSCAQCVKATEEIFEYFDRFHDEGIADRMLALYAENCTAYAKLAKAKMSKTLIEKARDRADIALYGGNATSPGS